MTTEVAFVFPGQGSQSVGMGREWADRHPAARRVFEQADEALGFSICRLCWHGPENELELTENTQPALLTTSVAILRVVQQAGIVPDLVAGHSLGEYSALVAAASLEFRDAVRLVRRRGQLMQEAVPAGEGAMAAILGLDPEAVKAVAEEASEDQVCAVANLNAPDQTVIAGHAAAIDRAMALSKVKGARRAIRLPVSAPFHSPLMAPAREALAPQLQRTTFADPGMPVVCNIDAIPVRSGADARDALIRQVDGPVRWAESVRWMTETGRVGLFVEVGPGKVLSGLVRRIAPQVQTVSLADPDALERLMDKVSEAR